MVINQEQIYLFIIHNNPQGERERERRGGSDI